MPPAKKSRRRVRCCYREGGRQCVRDGSGNPTLCGAHRSLVEIQARASSPGTGQPAGIFDGVSSVIEDLIAGRRVSSKVIRETVADLVGARMRSPGFTPFAQFTPFTPFGGGPRTATATRQPPPPPPVDELAAERTRARQVMGFAPGQGLTAEMIKTRKRELAKRLHPDKPGGSVARMAAVNDAADVLLAELG